MILVSFYFFEQNHQQLPEAKDVLKGVEDWSKPVNILTIEKIDGEWITFFRDSGQLYVGFLKQNWLGQWSLNERGETGGIIGEVSFQHNPEEKNGIVWGVSSLTKGNEPLFSIYYGMISNSVVDKITLSVDNEEPKNVPLIESNGERFFFIKKYGGVTAPYKFQAFSEGKLIAHEN
ncbi:hypothetical protein HNQ94_000078 [Salirhabdus euzebyi]|uniref:Uncharacterized protein n=1 Tax=Salirhabdus euzebyi TaxID=394506 RepID=A0A841PRV7_9BACI|nr:hypothetical protein [Salirhabdus euzebyi]MBB6451657.1 hypothetical protein [Salirhabdus euzebyi]